MLLPIIIIALTPRLGQIRLPASLLPDTNQYKLHPVLLDACLQTLWAIFPQEGQDESYLPIAFERLRLYPAQGGASRKFGCKLKCAPTPPKVGRTTPPLELGLPNVYGGLPFVRSERECGG